MTMKFNKAFSLVERNDEYVTIKHNKTGYTILLDNDFADFIQTLKQKGIVVTLIHYEKANIIYCGIVCHGIGVKKLHIGLNKLIHIFNTDGDVRENPFVLVTRDYSKIFMKDLRTAKVTGSGDNLCFDYRLDKLVFNSVRGRIYENNCFVSTAPIGEKYYKDYPNVPIPKHLSVYDKQSSNGKFFIVRATINIRGKAYQKSINLRRGDSEERYKDTINTLRDYILDLKAKYDLEPSAYEFIGAE